MFEDLPPEIQKGILLQEGLGKSRLISSVHRDILIDEFINNTTLPSRNEIIECVSSKLSRLLSFVTAYHSPIMEDAIRLPYDTNNIFIAKSIPTMNNVEYQTNDLVDVLGDGRVLYLKSGSIPEPIVIGPYSTIITGSSFGRGSTITDIRLFYNILKSRVNKLKLNISNNRIKKVLHNQLSLIRDILLEISDVTLYYYLYYSLDVLGHSVDKYSFIAISNIPNTVVWNIKTAKITIIPPKLLENMMSDCREAINNL